MSIAVVLVLSTSVLERADFAGRDCSGIDEAAAVLRELFALHSDKVVMAALYPGKTTSEVRAVMRAVIEDQELDARRRAGLEGH